jgi:Uma2 family endonuclease
MDPRTGSDESAGTRPLRRATYQDVLDAPENTVAELIEGELVLSPRPAKQHAFVQSELLGLLFPPFRRGLGGPGGWVFLSEPEIHLDDDIVVPDLAGWRKERAERVDEGAFFTTAPDWICEVLSPSTEARDRSDKLEIYARSHVHRVWLINPVIRTLEVYHRSELVWTRLNSWKGPAKVRHSRSTPWNWTSPCSGHSRSRLACLVDGS